MKQNMNFSEQSNLIIQEQNNFFLNQLFEIPANWILTWGEKI